MKQDHALDQSSDESFVQAARHDFGVPEHSRRLSDKLLAAYNHAYATGEREIAHQLKTILHDVEQRVRGLGRKTRNSAALADADKWTRFVDARDRYHVLKDDSRFDPATVGEALDEMKDAFKSWSLN